MFAPLPYVNDQWTLELRELGYDHVAQELAKMVLHSSPPFAACIAGRWGSGKTSVMRYVMTLLGGEPAAVRVPLGTHELKDAIYGDRDRIQAIQREGISLYRGASLLPLSKIGDAEWNELEEKAFGRVATLWFSPWRFQNDPSPMVPLLHALRDQLSTWAHTKDILDKAARMAIEAGLEGLAELAAAATAAATGLPSIGKAPDHVRRAGDRMDAARLAGPTDTERFSLLFEDAIGKILGAPHQNSPGLHEAGHRLVIFIDDLDRCEGSVSLRLLEAIKLYLATRYCVFVFGLDVTAVESAIAGAWAGRHRGLAREYLDKLFQAYVHMPMSTRYPILVHNRLADWRMIASEPLNPQSPLEKAHEAAHAIAAMLPSNPRKVKNFLNALRVAWEIAGLRGKSPPPNLKRFALVQRLRALAPATFRLIAQNPLEYIPELSDFFNACLVKSPISRGQNAHRLSVLLSDFGHIAVLDRDWEKAAANPSLTFDELHVRLDSIASDRDFARAWCENVIRPDEFCRYGGIGADHAASVGP